MMWNFARSAEDLFMRGALKRVFKFFLKKKLGQFILGDVDLDQLDVQLGAGTIHLSDLVLNVDFINQKLGKAALVTVSEGSIGSLSIKIPWKSKGCEIEINELEIVLTPWVGGHSSAGAEKVSDQDGTSCTSDVLGKLDHGMEDHAAAPAPVDVHEGVKTIAKMVKWLLTSFHVKVKRLIVAFDSCLENEKNIGSEMVLVLRIMEIECGTCVSEDVDSSGLERVESFLGIDRLTNFAKFQGAVMELLQMDESHKKTGSVFGERFSRSCATATIPILTGNHAGFSGTLKLSIPWKSGSLDTCKVDSEVCIDPVELRLQPRVIEWLLLMCKSLQNLGIDSMCEPDRKTADSIYYNSASHFHCSALGSSAIATDKALLNSESPRVDHGAPKHLEAIAGTSLPGSNLILDWVPLSAEKNQDQAGEAYSGASVDHFFECFDELRSSQSALGGSGIWNWTSSVFSAITVASNLASGSLHIPSEQQHAQTNLKATVTRFSVLLSFDDECMKQICFRKGGQRNFSPNAHYLGVECEDVHLVLQVCPGEMKVEATVRHVEVSEFFKDGIDIMDFGSDICENGINSKTLLVQHLQAKVQDALPPFALSTEDSVKSHGSAATDFPFGRSPMDDSDGKSIYMDDLVKVDVLKSSNACCCQYTVSSKFSNDSTTRSTSFSLELPPFVLWVNFNLLKMLMDLWKGIGSYFETRDLRDIIVSEANNTKHVSSFQENTKGISYPFVATSSPNGNLQGNVIFANARAILCFPFENKKDVKCYPAWDQFIVLNLSSPLPLGKKVKKGQDADTVSDAPKRFSLTASDSLHLNIGNLELYLVTSCQKNGVRNNVSQRKFSAQNVIRANGTHSPSHISVIWQEGPVTGPSLVARAKELAASGISRNNNKVVGKGYEFAAVTTLQDMKESKLHSWQEIIAGSAFLLHARLPPVTVNLDNSLYHCLYSLLNQAVDGFSCLSCDPPSISEDLIPIASQTSLLVECDYVEISIYPDVARVPKGSMQDQLPGPWHRLRLKVQKFELLAVSNIGGITSANFNWIGHGEGNLWGFPAGSADQEFVLISCNDSTMRRGDGLNALSYGFAGSDIINLSDPRSFYNSTFITVRCATIVALGGQLDWLGVIFSFFSLGSSGFDGSDDKQLQKNDSKESDTFGTSFILDLVDIGLSYEPYIRNISMDGEISKFDSNSESFEEGEKPVACILAAASLSLSLVTIADSNDHDYRIKVHDLGLLLSVVSRPENIVGLYSTKHLQEIGYVKVAEEAFVEAILRTNCKNGLLWELECSESHSHIIFDTCHDTTAGLLRLVAQLQQLFSPDVEESLVHLQSRWDNVQKVHAMNDPIDDTTIVNIDTPLSASCVSTINTDIENKPGVFGLMDEISEDAFQLNECLHNASDSFQRQLCISVDGTEEECSGRARALESFSHNDQSSFLEKGCIPEVIEGYCRPGLLSPITDQSLFETSTSNSSTMGKGGKELENSGWYSETSLNIVENYMSEVEEEDLTQFIGQLAFNSFTKGGEFQGARGRILLKNINVKWRMHSGSDWLYRRQTGSSSFRGRDKTACLELAFCGIDFQCNIFPEGQICASKLSFSIQDFYLHDKSKDAPWELVLDNYDSKEHPRESSSKAFKLDLEAVRPDPLTPLDEYRLNIAFLPMRLHLHQTQLDFLITFFEGKTSSVEQSPSLPPDLDESPAKYDTSQHTVSDKALLPYFQKVDIWPFLIRVDYTPSRVDLAALRDGKYAELVNLVPWKGVELQLKHVHAVGVYGWGTVCETVIGDWLEDISQNQIHKLLRGLPPIRSLVSVGSGAAKLISLPVKSYKDRRLLKGMQRGTMAFLKSISIEAVGLGLHLTEGVHGILLQTEYILTSVPASVSLPVATRTKKNVRSNQPKDAQQGFQQAYESLTDGLGRSASALVQAPLKSYQRGAGAGSALATAICAAPAAAIAPASAAAGAVRFALLGVRNSLDPEHKRESMKKYLGPTQPHEPS